MNRKDSPLPSLRDTLSPLGRGEEILSHNLQLSLSPPPNGERDGPRGTIFLYVLKSSFIRI